MSVQNKGGNYSNAYSSRGQLIVDSIDTIPFWVKTFEFPNISVDNFDIDLDNYVVKGEGNKVVYGEMNVTLFIDEDYTNYTELFDWINGKLNDKFDKSTNTTKHDGRILLYNNAYTTITKSIILRGLNITNLSTQEMDLTNVEEKTMDATLTFDYMEIKR